MLSTALTLSPDPASAQATAPPAATPVPAPAPAPVRLPPGTRVVDGRYLMARGLAEATRQLEQRLDAAGAAFQRIGPTRVRGIEITRFLSLDPDSSWLALHLVRKEGRTFLDVVERTPP